MAMHVRKGDLIQVTSGKDRGRQGTIMRILPGGERVLVEGINIRKKNVKRSQTHPQGGTIDKELPIHISNVSPVAGGKPTRIRFEKKDDGSKVRIAVRTGDKIGPELKQAKKK